MNYNVIKQYYKSSFTIFPRNRAGTNVHNTTMMVCHTLFHCYTVTFMGDIIGIFNDSVESLLLVKTPFNYCREDYIII